MVKNEQLDILEIVCYDYIEYLRRKSEHLNDMALFNNSSQTLLVAKSYDALADNILQMLEYLHVIIKSSSNIDEEIEIMNKLTKVFALK